MPTETTPEPVTNDNEEAAFVAAVAESVGTLPPPKPPADDNDASAEDFLGSVSIERSVPDITMPWMAAHEMLLVRTLDEVRKVVDDAIASGHCALDLETEGLDNRIFYEELPPDIDPVSGVQRKRRGKPYTKHRIVGFCLSYGDAKKGFYIPVRHRPADGNASLNVEPVEEVEAEIRRLCLASQPTPKPGQTDPLAFKEFETPPRVIIDFWHASFDQEFLYPITGIDFWHPDSFEDGYLASFVKYTGDKNIGLKNKAEELLKDSNGNSYKMIELKQLFPIRGAKIDFAALAPDEPGVVKYGCSDAICTRLLCALPDLVPLVRKKYGQIYRIEKQVAQVKRVMERHRVKVNRARINELRAAHEKARDEVRARIVEFAASRGIHNFEPGSPKQLSDLLFTKDGLDITLPNCGPDDKDFPNGKPPINEKSKQYKTGADVLDELAKAMGDNAPPLLKWILEYREEDKILGTYLDNISNNLDVNDELRFSFKQTGAATGRFSAPANDPEQGYSGIPVHGIPATSDLRTCFVARDGYTMVKNDYAGEELRIVTNLSNETVWITEFNTGTGDLHTITARAFFGKQEVSKDERKMGKIANFALVYGGGPAAIMRATGCDRMEGTRRKQAFDKAVPEFAKWVKGQHAKVKKELGVWTAFGRWIAIPDANSPENAIRAACERHSTNYPIQGSGADIMKIAMILIHKELYRRGWFQDDSVRMLLTVHDEIVFEIRHDRVVEVIPILVAQMELPTHMAKPPYSPPWKVPLITEPLVGPTWGTGYPCERAHEGHKLKEGEIIVNGFLYGTIRTVDLGKDRPGEGEVEHWRDEKAKKLKIRMVDPKWLANLPPPAPLQDAPTVPVPVQVEAPKVITHISTPTHTNDATKTVTLRLKLLSLLSVEQVRALCARYVDPQGALLQLVDPISGRVLIDPKLGVKVNAEKFALALLEQNLSDGKMLFS